jgi:hypothetical protein
MMQAKPVVNNQYPHQKTFGEKLVSVLRQPIFTFTLPQSAKKKPELQKTIKPLVPKNETKHNRSISGKGSVKPTSVRNASQGKRTATYTFTPARNKDEFDKINFVLRACDGNKSTSFTNVLHVESTKYGSSLIATDGKRLHVTEIKTKVKPGDYKPVVTKDKVTLGVIMANVSFPDWKRVVPVNVTRRGCISIDNASISEYSRVYKSFTEMSGEKINPNYLSDLTKNPWVIYCQNEKRKALLLKEYGVKETYAVIMPLSS